MPPSRAPVTATAGAGRLAGGDERRAADGARGGDVLGLPNQKAAQAVADTRDADGDGIYCEELPCPCSTEVGGSGGDDGDRDDGVAGSCTKPGGVQRVVFSKSKCPNVREHLRIALRKGWPRRLVVNPRRRAPRPAAGGRPDQGGL